VNERCTDLEECVHRRGSDFFIRLGTDKRLGLRGAERESDLTPGRAELPSFDLLEEEDDRPIEDHRGIAVRDLAAKELLQFP